ncbi:serine/threonine-protein kinase [Streptomyces apocyni]|uniref:serine/threonine-protein kinase n=1 Tax=Streptomyces apocyni TaxID=2654677 RepID=UPI0012EAB4D3|nr:serine/threonine-protein kinase [Streptomyces apocyni]
MGEVFAGRYELVDPIGRGGAGAVWRVWDRRRRRYVAAKVLRQRDAHSLLRFVREQAMRIDHPHLLAPASWAADDDQVLFTMDLVAGGSLAHLVGDYGPLPARYVCTLLDQLLSGLSAVHAEGVVHRDIKPANILLEATGTGRPHLRLSDFGIAMRRGEPRLTETDYVMGTPGYFAPEQLLGAEPHAAADLFATGLVTLYLLEGAKPDAEALVDLFTERGTPDAPEGIPEPLWQVVATLLQPDPDARFRTATGARKALAEAVELLPEASPTDEPVEVFDQLGPLPPGFDADGPHRQTSPAAPSVPPHAPPGGTGGGLPVPPPPITPAPGPGAGAGAGARSGLAPVDSDGSRTNTPLPPAPVEAPGSQPPADGLPPTPPPQRPAAAPQPRPQLQPQPPSTPAPPQAWQPQPSPTHAAVPPHQAPTAPARQHTAQLTQLPTQLPAAAPVIAKPPAPRAAHARRKRPGPPPQVTVPVLLLALVCFAVGFWALAQT